MIDFYAAAEDRVSIVFFWATWCPYCRALIPHLQRLSGELDIPVFALNVWEDSDPRNYFKKRGISFKLLLDAEAVAASYGIKGTPGLFVVGGDHLVRYARTPAETAGEAEIAVRQAIAAARDAGKPKN